VDPCIGHRAPEQKLGVPSHRSGKLPARARQDRPGPFRLRSDQGEVVCRVTRRLAGEKDPVGRDIRLRQSRDCLGPHPALRVEIRIRTSPLCDVRSAGYRRLCGRDPVFPSWSVRDSEHGQSSVVHLAVHQRLDSGTHDATRGDRNAGRRRRSRIWRLPVPSAGSTVAGLSHASYHAPALKRRRKGDDQCPSFAPTCAISA
jgi:hypothetical protein